MTKIPVAAPIQPVRLYVEKRASEDSAKPMNINILFFIDVFSFTKKAKRKMTVKLNISLAVIGYWKTDGPDSVMPYRLEM